MMKKIILLIFALILIVRAYICFPKNYFTPAVECNSDGMLIETGDPLASENQQVLRAKIRTHSSTDFRYFLRLLLRKEVLHI